MEDKEIKKELDKIPDVDENGDPVYKIDDAEDSGKSKNDEVPLFVEETSEAPKGNPQDIKDSTEE